jgi:uncharacterized protein (TIGR02145 family)
MREVLYKRLVVIAFAMVIILSGCKKNLPVLTTLAVKNITATTAESGGRLSHLGRSKVISAGICLDTIGNSTTESRIEVDSVAKKQFVTKIRGLLPNKTYYIRAYAVNVFGTVYGDLITFTTPASIPVLKTTEISDININSAVSGGEILSDGGSPVINSGVCWDTVANPTTSVLKTSISDGLSTFTSDIYGLKPNKSYFVRAYATNSLGTAYGEEIEFKTPTKAPLITTVFVTEKYLYSASCSVLIKSDGGSKITEYGICWNTKPGPTISNAKTSKQYARGKFRMKNLKPGTTYYVRSYAINSEGTGYGKALSFKTLGSLPKVMTLAASNLSISGASVKAVVNPGYLPTNVSFEYGLNKKYGQTAALSSAEVNGKADTTIIIQLSGLKPGTEYHFRGKATNILGTSYGMDSMFVILMMPNLTGFPPISKNNRDSSFFITPPASNSPGAFTYSTSNPKIAIIKDGKVIINGSGTCTITATQEPNGLFAKGSISTTFSMNVVDIDGNVYKTVAIGNQDWMKENLKVTRYRNGEQIPNITDNGEWISVTEGAFCWINNDTTNRNNRFGGLYNWFAAVDSRKICPIGWHVPTDAEWQVMERYLGMTFAEAEETILRGADQGLQLKDTVGWIKNGTGSNSSDFSAIPAGLRDAKTGDFFNAGIDGCWWTSTQEDENNAWLRNMYYYFKSIYRISDSKKYGFSVRCVRDRKQ